MGCEGGEILRALWVAPLDWKSRAVEVAMATHGSEGTGRCVVNVEALANLNGLPCRSVERALAELAEAGFLTRNENRERYADNEALRAAPGPSATQAP